MAPLQHVTLNPSHEVHATRDAPQQDAPPAASLPEAKEIKVKPNSGAPIGSGNASLYFVGTATTILEWHGVRIMTDPNFLHAGDHVHLGPGVTATRKTNPAVDLHDLPRIDAVLLSHYHADHFDSQVEESLRRDLPIITTPHAKHHLGEETKGGKEAFQKVTALDFWDSALVDVVGQEGVALKVTGMPGKHVPSGMLSQVNDLLGAVPPTNGWMLELGKSGNSDSDFECGYRIYISGDTLLIDELSQISERYTHAGKPVDLMLIHLGGTTIPGPSMPLLMVTMDAKQGIELVRLISPDLTIPIHYDDYDVFLSPLSDFKKAVSEAGLDDKVVYLDRGDKYEFAVR